jgi:hypothetical protein
MYLLAQYLSILSETPFSGVRVFLNASEIQWQGTDFYLQTRYDKLIKNTAWGM